MNKVILGDCLEVMKTLLDNSIDAIITDPPYFNTNLDFDKDEFNWTTLWDELKRVVKPNGIVCIFSQIRPAIEVILSNPKQFRYQIVWHKTMPLGFLSANTRPLRAHELILVFCEKFKRSCYNPQMGVGKAYEIKREGQFSSHYGQHRTNTTNTGDRYPVDVIKFSNANFQSLHPTQKPLDLIKYLILTYSNENEIILDPFAGSGTTAIACLETNRNYICIEKDPKYYDVIQQRISKWHNDKLDATGTHVLPDDVERNNVNKYGQLSLF